MIGISKNKVILATYSIKWGELYNIEKDLILSSIGNYTVDIQHVGSTSIPGMISSPVIDIVVGLKNFDDGFEIISTIENLGYNFKGALGKSRRFFFWKGTF
ncbi:MAG: GrpB family protein [Romboutsia sp.]